MLLLLLLLVLVNLLHLEAHVSLRWWWWWWWIGCGGCAIGASASLHGLVRRYRTLGAVWVWTYVGRERGNEFCPTRTVVHQVEGE